MGNEHLLSQQGHKGQGSTYNTHFNNNREESRNPVNLTFKFARKVRLWHQETIKIQGENRYSSSVQCDRFRMTQSQHARDDDHTEMFPIKPTLKEMSIKHGWMWKWHECSLTERIYDKKGDKHEIQVSK